MANVTSKVTELRERKSALQLPLHLRRFRHRIPGFAKLVRDHFVDVEIDLPVIVGVAIASHGEQRAFGGELADFYFGGGGGEDVFDGG